jgi:alpha-glucuronidase
MVALPSRHGANMLADAVAPHGGIIMWRAFVYSQDELADRARQAYPEFVPLDGEFRDNVVLQVKNGAIDFQPREPFHPLFGAMPRTPLMLEVQITKEYLGFATHLVYLAPLFEETRRSDTYARGKNSTVAKVIDGSLFGNDSQAKNSNTGMAGVANIGSDRNWTGSHFDQGIGFDRTATGSNAVAQYAPQVAAQFADLKRVPEKFLLWFHHVPWDYRMPSGRTLWDELVIHYTRGVQTVSDMRRTWSGLSAYVDPERFAQVSAFLIIQEKEARWWRDASIAYFQTLAKRPLPAGYDPPDHDLQYYETLCFPYAPGTAPRLSAVCK